VLPLDSTLAFDAQHDAEFFKALPPRPAVVLIEPREPSAEPFLIRTANLRRRLERLLGPPEILSKRLNLRDFAGSVRYRVTGSRFEQAFAYYQHARHLFPRRYQALARLRPPAVLKVNLTSAYPRCYVTRKIRTSDTTGLTLGGIYYGPFASRHAAEAFAEKFLDLFKIRRCQIKIRRDPAFPGCIYSEMKMCLAPCFAGCTSEQYAGEVARVVRFLESSGASLTSEIAREREAASDALDFEGAAALHRRLEKVNEVLRGLPDLPRKVDEFDAVILQRAVEENTIAIFAVRAGRIAEPFLLRFAELAGQPRSVEEMIRTELEPPASLADASACGSSQADRLQGARNDRGKAKLEIEAGKGSDKQNDSLAAMNPCAALMHDARKKEDISEHLALVSRWYYSKPREGEIFFRQDAWPYRRILRACSRILAAPAPQPPATSAAPPPPPSP
jgi:excinuclease UvrABC nuclease subunit